MAAPAVAIIFLAGMSFIFGWLLDKQRNPNQSVLTQISSDGGTSVVLQRNRRGHYLASGAINGSLVEFFLDTGATDVVIPGHIGEQLGLQKGAVMTAQTANGVIQVYQTWLDSVSLGEITLHNVAASINPAMHGQQILLGMSFLRHLELVQRDGQLKIRVPKA
ncbi:MAG: TIGR02281 family clan AA aspartic protease [Acidiferrobacterales bacterium]|nr:TIGR02281 family clan AA aspartic protease [Acidiferrobacterales bacterium]